MTKAYYLISIIAAITLLLSACQPSQGTLVANNGTQDDIGELHVTRTEPAKTATKVEEFPLPNCGGTDKLTQSLGTQTSVLKGLTVGTKATLAGGVEVEIPETVKFKLEQKVEDSYQEEYQTANSRIDALNMTAAPGTHVVYVILWEDSKYSSEISYVMNGAVYKVPYTYVLSVPKISESRKVDCPGDEPAQSPSNPVIPTPAPLPTTAPTQPSASQPSKPTNAALQPPWDILLSNWQETKILKQYGDKTVVAVGPFIFKVISNKGNFCGVVTPGTTLDSVKELGTPLLEHWPITYDNLIAYLTMSDGKNNDSYDMEDFCLDPPVYTFVILHETNGAITMQKMKLPVLPGP